MHPEEIIHVPVPREALTAVYRVLTGDYAVVHVSEYHRPSANPDVVTTQTSQVTITEASAELPTEGEERDSAGWPWRADLHAGSKGKTKDGLWRMKTGVERPAPLTGAEPHIEEAVEAPEPEVEEVEEPQTLPDLGDEDEAWAQAAAEAAAPVEVPTREWADQDLASACSAAVTAMGGEAKVPVIKALVADYVSAGDVPHSRNIPSDDRQKFIDALVKLVRENGKPDFDVVG